MDSEEQLMSTVRRLEELLLATEVRRSPEKVTSLLTEDFVEHGASGRVYDRQATIDGLSHEPTTPMAIDEFKVRSLAPDVVLATYRLVKRGDSLTYSLRCSIWERANGQWRMAFHQGTRTEGPGLPAKAVAPPNKRIDQTGEGVAHESQTGTAAAHTQQR